MAQNFETALRAQIAAHKGTKKYKRIMKLLDSKKSNMRTRRLARLERHALAHIEQDGRAGFDWSSIDWGKLFENLLSFLLKILDLFGEEPPVAEVKKDTKAKKAKNEDPDPDEE